MVKGDGGATLLTEDPAALCGQMVAGPEVSHFERVEAHFKVLKEMGNLFQEELAHLLVLDTKNIADPTLTEIAGTHHQRGK